ncbi:hypothetical protein Tco_0958694 [Tanacetum coccineum]
MDDRGASSLCIMLDSAPSGPSLSVVPSAWLVGVDCNRVGKGGSRVLIPDLVVYSKCIGWCRVSVGQASLLSLSCRISFQVSHPAKAETRGATSWISSQHNGVNNRESLNA